MSTLKTINIIHPTGSTNNMVSDAGGNVTVGNNLTVTGNSTVTGNKTVVGNVSVSSNVAIGGATVGQAGYRFALQGYAASSVPLYLHSDATNAYLYSPNPVYLGSTGANTTVLVSNNTARFTVGTSGQLGIGVSPSYGSAGQVLVSGGASTAPSWASTINANTAVASTSTAAIDFTGIPTWARRITVMLAGVTTPAGAVATVRIGSGGTAISSGYVGMNSGTSNSGTAVIALSTGFTLVDTGTAASICAISGLLTLDKINGNTWVASSTMGVNSTTFTTLGGYLALGAALDIVRLTTTTGSANFTAGTVNILYE